MTVAQLDSARPLYEHEQIQVGYLGGASAREHTLRLLGEGDALEYVLPRDVLRELATTPSGDIEQKISNFNPAILGGTDRRGISLDRLHVALCQACIEEMRRDELLMQVMPR